MKPLILLSLIAPGAAFAAESSLPSAAGSLFQMLFGLAFVLVLMFGALHLLKKVQGPTAAGGNLKIMGATAVGPRERVVLLAVGETVLVLGVAPGQISALHSMPLESLPAPQATMNAPGGDFAARLKQFMETRRGK